jgi:hypothetical protein
LHKNVQNTNRYILTGDGRIVPKTGGGFKYEYFIKDHMGNIRLTKQDSMGIAAIKQEYYCFTLQLHLTDRKYLRLHDNLRAHLLALQKYLCKFPIAPHNRLSC